MEINARVNYPLKACLIQLEERQDFNMDCTHVKFCVSWFSIRVASVGTSLAVQAWNDHPIPGTVNNIFPPKLIVTSPLILLFTIRSETWSS